MTQSYDEISRKTVLEPDGSVRPTKDQERAAFAGERILSAEESALQARVGDALRTSGLDISRVTVEIDDTRVTLRGQVLAIDLLPKLETAIHTVSGVGEVVDLLVVAAGT